VSSRSWRDRPLKASPRTITPVNAAYHEAGHAVAAFLNRRALTSVVMEIGRDGCSGYITCEPPVFEPSRHTGPIDDETRRAIETDVVILLAGPFLEEAVGAWNATSTTTRSSRPTCPERRGARVRARRGGRGHLRGARPDHRSRAQARGELDEPPQRPLLSSAWRPSPTTCSATSWSRT
jgi:hypothetical protein